MRKTRKDRRLSSSVHTCGGGQHLPQDDLIHLLAFDAPSSTLITFAPSVAAGMPDKDPLKDPMAVRPAPMITTLSFMFHLFFYTLQP